jgi:hypothetical protein
MIGASLVFLVTGFSWAGTQETPWSGEAAATRQAAVREGRACVLLLNSDAEAY